MKRFERVLVCVDRPERDGRMLGYVDFVARTARSREVHLLHVAREGVDGAAQGPEVTRDTLSGLATEHLKSVAGQGRPCEVVTGGPLIEVLRYAHDKDVDLIVVGRGRLTEVEEGRGTLAMSRSPLCRRATGTVHPECRLR